MNCPEIRALLGAYADGELDLVHSVELEQHLKTCTACAAEFKSQQALQSGLRQSRLRYRAPDALRQSVRQLARESAPPRKKYLPWLWQWLALGATAVAVLAVVSRPGGLSERDQLLNEAVNSHVRSLMVEHLTDVASSDQHTVKPWFDGKLDFAPAVKDFAEQGFPLVGGRLDYLDHRPVAALVYRHSKHLINVFVWPASAGSWTSETRDLRGYSVIARDAGGFHYCLVSDLNAKELGQLADLLGK